MKKIENKRNKLAIANKIKNDVLPIEESPTAVNDDVITEEKPKPLAGDMSKEGAPFVNMTENVKVIVDITPKKYR